jgi:hypothetical protein
MSYCSPNLNVVDHYTCFDMNELLTIADAFNSYNKNNNKNRIRLNKQYTKQELWNEIYNKLKNICQYEYCWIDLQFIDAIPDKELRNKIKYFTFKPKMTIKQYSWLSTNDINYVLRQYEKIDDNFKFIGALPSDFYKVLPKQLMKEIYNDILIHRRIGIVFNLDSYNQKGSHWVAFYIDHNNKTIEYFDSLGNPPNKRIYKFIKKINSKIKKHKQQQYKLLINNIIHQNENSECGIYSIYYIIHRLFGNTFSELTNNIIKDKDMNKFRFNIFRPRQ